MFLLILTVYEAFTSVIYFYCAVVTVSNAFVDAHGQYVLLILHYVHALRHCLSGGASRG